MHWRLITSTSVIIAGISTAIAMARNTDTDLVLAPAEHRLVVVVADIDRVRVAAQVRPGRADRDLLDQGPARAQGPRADRVRPEAAREPVDREQTLRTVQLHPARARRVDRALPHQARLDQARLDRVLPDRNRRAEPDPSPLRRTDLAWEVDRDRADRDRFRRGCDALRRGR